jgi:cytoskeleton protein RodZ
MSDGVVEAAAAPVPPVNLLTAARTAAGMAVADAARHLKLSPWQVEALESGDYARLPGPVFVRGFIRNYARLLKIDPSPLLAEIAAQAAVATAVPIVDSGRTEAIPFPGPRHLNLRPYAIGVLVIVAMLVAYEFYGDESAPPEGDTRAVVVELPEPRGVTEAKPAEPATPEKAPSASPAAAPRAETVTPAPAAEFRGAAPVPRNADDQVVRMMFSRESWVEVRDRQGRIIFSQLNAPGTAQAVSGQPPLRLVVGNASGVRLMFNDRAVDLAPFSQVDVARLTLE